MTKHRSQRWTAGPLVTVKWSKPGRRRRHDSRRQQYGSVRIGNRTATLWCYPSSIVGDRRGGISIGIRHVWQVEVKYPLAGGTFKARWRISNRSEEKARKFAEKKFFELHASFKALVRGLVLETVRKITRQPGIRR